jgi:hypothetical protein
MIKRRHLMALFLLAALTVATASSAQSPNGTARSDWKQLTITFRGAGSGTMTEPTSQQVWTKKVQWTLVWHMRQATPSAADFLSRAATITGSSSWRGDANLTTPCTGPVSYSGTPAQITHVQAANPLAPALVAIQVPIFGPVAKACFGANIMAVAQKPLGRADSVTLQRQIIDAAFAYDLANPRSLTLKLNRNWNEKYKMNSGSVSYSWSATIKIAVG